jgi:hypothetical protein
MGGFLFVICMMAGIALHKAYEVMFVKNVWFICNTHEGVSTKIITQAGYSFG